MAVRSFLLLFVCSVKSEKRRQSNQCKIVGLGLKEDIRAVLISFREVALYYAPDRLVVSLSPDSSEAIYSFFHLA